MNARIDSFIKHSQSFVLMQHIILTKQCCEDLEIFHQDPYFGCHDMTFQLCNGTIIIISSSIMSTFPLRPTGRAATRDHLTRGTAG